MDESDLQDHTDRLIDEIDYIIEKLEYDENLAPFRLLGIKASYELLQSVLFTSVIVIIAII